MDPPTWTEPWSRGLQEEKIDEVLVNTQTKDLIHVSKE